MSRKHQNTSKITYDASTLAAYACSDATSRGRIYKEQPPKERGEYQRDRDRIVHSAAFRRLEYKTQVFVNHEGDLFRTRLTHSIEVAQISRSIARALRLNEDLTETIALAHDLGHPPFGHAGQDILNQCCLKHGGFEHNFQSLRIVDVLEERYAEFSGLNLTFESREGILKHCSPKRAKKLGELGTRFLRHHQPSLEAQLVNLADEITYVCHDIDDGLRAQLLAIDQLKEIGPFAGIYSQVTRQYPSLTARRVIHETMRRLVNYLVTDVIDTSRAMLADASPSHPDVARRHSTLLVKHSGDVEKEVSDIKTFLYRHLYNHDRIKAMHSEAQKILEFLYFFFLENPRHLPESEYQKSLSSTDSDGESGLTRVVTDYIAGMTDRYATIEYQRLLGTKVVS